MKTPICNVCLKSDILCNGCQRKLKDGSLTQTGVEVLRFLYELSDSISNLEDVEIEQIITDPNVILILTAEGDAPKVVGNRGRVVKKIAEKFERPVRIIEDTTPREIAEGILSPVEVKGVNTVYKKEGEAKKVVIDEDDLRRVPFSQERFKELTKELAGKEYLLGVD